MRDGAAVVAGAEAGGVEGVLDKRIEDGKCGIVVKLLMAQKPIGGVETGLGVAEEVESGVAEELNGSLDKVGGEVDEILEDGDDGGGGEEEARVEGVGDAKRKGFVAGL